MLKHATEAYYQNKIEQLEGKIKILMERIAQLEGDRFINDGRYRG